ncbi:DUF2231 domain-containing protein [Coraliomargarita parva]|uniref:DUF2231 domain-containing protein n=1 Tax=Coraliomargarita parva TaxID=3014050 RepID=UPI0022B58B2F|nr:DUF2231 domain-containing protein [Coraliomargarita parva]
MKRILPLLFLLLGSVSAQTINTMCPVTPDEAAESWITTTYQGQTIGFCCKSCLRKFNADPEAYLSNLGLGSPADTTANTTSDSETEGIDANATRPSATTNPDNTVDTAGTEPTRPPILVFLGKLHVLSVHLPIALLPLAGMLEILAILFKSRPLQFAARLNFLLGACFAVVAAGLGWIAASQSNYPGELADVLTWHRWLGMTVASLGLIGAVGMAVSRTSKAWGIYIYRTVALILLILVPVTAHFGGSLIYGIHYLF